MRFACLSSLFIVSLCGSTAAQQGQKVNPAAINWGCTSTSPIYNAYTGLCQTAGTANNPGGSPGQIQVNEGGSSFGGISLVPASQGGTGINTSAATGYPVLNAGNWSIAANLPYSCNGPSCFNGNQFNAPFTSTTPTTLTSGTTTSATTLSVASTAGYPATGGVLVSLVDSSGSHFELRMCATVASSTLLTGCVPGTNASTPYAFPTGSTVTGEVTTIAASATSPVSYVVDQAGRQFYNTFASGLSANVIFAAASGNIYGAAFTGPLQAPYGVSQFYGLNSSFFVPNTSSSAPTGTCSTPGEFENTADGAITVCNSSNNWTPIYPVPTLNQNTTGSAGSLSAASTLPNGTNAATQSKGDASADLATDAFAASVTYPNSTLVASAATVQLAYGLTLINGTATITSFTPPTGFSLTQGACTSVFAVNAWVVSPSANTTTNGFTATPGYTYNFCYYNYGGTGYWAVQNANYVSPSTGISIATTGVKSTITNTLTTGVSGGQTIVGGTANTDFLFLEPTSGSSHSIDYMHLLQGGGTSGGYGAFGQVMQANADASNYASPVFDFQFYNATGAMTADQFEIGVEGCYSSTGTYVASGTGSNDCANFDGRHLYVYDFTNGETPIQVNWNKNTLQDVIQFGDLANPATQSIGAQLQSVGNVVLEEQLNPTTSNNYNSAGLYFVSAYMRSSSYPDTDTWYIAPVLGTGINPTTKLVIGHNSGASSPYPPDANQQNLNGGSTGTASISLVAPASATVGFTSNTYGTATNCSSAASPAVCGSAAAGSAVLAASTTTIVVDDTDVTANSQIILTFDASLGTKLGVTCNTTGELLWVSARSAGTSFTVTGAAPTTNPACFSFVIFN